MKKMIKKKNIILAIISFLFVLVLTNYFAGCGQQAKKGLKVYFKADLEGASGVITFNKHSYETGIYYEQSKILLTKEINAAVEGLLEEGVSEIVVLDDHGPGGINIDYLHPAAEVIMGENKPVTLDSSFDALIFLGQHSMSNTPNGNLAHSFSSRTINNIWLNGKLFGEIADMVLLASHFNVPTIFLSGDAAACNEIKDLIPNVETVAVKKGLGLNAALCLSPEQARKEIKAGVKRAIRKIEQIKLYKVEPPYEVVVEYKDYKTADYKEKKEGWTRIDSMKCSYKTNDYLSVKH
jgi:D-amino peptidase